MLEDDPRYGVARRLVDDVDLELSRTGAWTRAEVRVAPQAQIAAAAHEQNAELVVIGSRGRLGATGFLTGSVGRDVLAVARVPVLIVREHAELPEGAPRKLLLAIDGVHGTRRLTDLDLDLARAFGAEVLVAHVGFQRTAELEGESGLPDADQRMSASSPRASNGRADYLQGLERDLTRKIVLAWRLMVEEGHLVMTFAEQPDRLARVSGDAAGHLG